ncbi:MULTISPECIES: hypothetical protein [unclassified Variovorax]|uniref:hypothetical protein n=1 Tax=unclassified Variovorax TaxID=663243 RepID=UPI003F467FCE
MAFAPPLPASGFTRHRLPQTAAPGMTTAVHPVAKGQRALLSFSVEGLPPREELLFKSLVRLLDHRTHQHWAWRVDQADLRVVGQDAHTDPDAPLRAVPVLAVGQADAPRSGHFLALPLHAEELEKTLNRLGAMVVHARGLGLAAAEAEPADDDEFRLLRWPPAALLETPHRVRLATLMTGRPTSLGVLRQRSGLAAQDCLAFIADLRRSGLLENVREAARAVQHAADGPQPEATAPAAPPVRDPVQPGLLARIRSRLGLLPAGHR